MANVKTINGLLRANCKTRNGLASANIKTINGVDAVVSGGSPFGGAVSTTNLVEWWPLSEASGIRVGVHAGLDLTDNNTVTGVSGGGPDGSNVSQFTATNSEYLSRASESALQTGDIDFTFSGWIYLDSKAAAGGYRTLAAKADFGASQFEWVIDHRTDTDRFRFTVCTDGSTSFATVEANSFGSPSIGTWYSILAWHDATANTINIKINNGTTNSTAHSGGVFSGTGAFHIGRTDGTLGRYHNGRSQRCGFFKRIPDAGDAAAFYNSGNGLDY